MGSGVEGARNSPPSAYRCISLHGALAHVIKPQALVAGDFTIEWRNSRAVQESAREGQALTACWGCGVGSIHGLSLFLFSTVLKCNF
jgi:hypothetical protein